MKLVDLKEPEEREIEKVVIDLELFQIESGGLLFHIVKDHPRAKSGQVAVAPIPGRPVTILKWGTKVQVVSRWEQR